MVWIFYDFKKTRKLCQQDIDLKKQQMRNQLTSLIPSAIFLDDEIFSLFVLLPWDSDSSFDSLTSLLEQLCPGLENGLRCQQPEIRA